MEPLLCLRGCLRYDVTSVPILSLTNLIPKLVWSFFFVVAVAINSV